jgi:hypothetical protein
LPGSPATTPHLGIPRFSNADAADFATDVNSVADAVEAALAAPALVTSLPGSPYDGQQVLYDAGGGVIWRLRYNSGSASAYKWEAVGAGALISEDLAVRTPAGSAILALGPTITVPLAGEYEAAYGSHYILSPSAMLYLGIDAALDIATQRVLIADISSTGFAQAHGTLNAPAHKRTFTAGQVVNLYGQNVGSGSGSFTQYGRSLTIRPIRVG